MLPTVPRGSKVTQQCDLGKSRKVPLTSRNSILIPVGNEHTVLSTTKLKKSSLFSVRVLPDSTYAGRTHFSGCFIDNLRRERPEAKILCEVNLCQKVIQSQCVWNVSMRHNVYIHRELWQLPLPGMLRMCLYPKKSERYHQKCER